MEVAQRAICHAPFAIRLQLINPDARKPLDLQRKKLRGKSLNRIASPESGLYQVRLSVRARRAGNGGQ
jgi:hypothetical protein